MHSVGLQARREGNALSGLQARREGHALSVSAGQKGRALSTRSRPVRDALSKDRVDGSRGTTRKIDLHIHVYTHKHMPTVLLSCLGFKDVKTCF